MLSIKKHIMKTTKKFTCRFLVLFGIVALLFGSCSKDEKETAEVPVLSTTVVSSITQTTAVSGGNITDDGGASVTERGVCWSSSNVTPTTRDSKTTDGAGSGSFTSDLSGLSPGTEYYVRAYATNSEGTAYGSTLTFTTLEDGGNVVYAELTTTDITEITQTTAVSGGNITSDGGAPVTMRGVCWGTNESPTVNDSKTEDGNGSGVFTSNITGLAPNTTYYVRAYSINSTSTSYGQVKSFTTLEEAVAPTVTTAEVTEINRTTAVSGGNVTDDGGDVVTARGVCWSTNENPTITDSKTTDGEGVGSFTSNMEGLAQGTTYYVRAYATNSVGTSYGEAHTFTTSQTGITVEEIEGEYW